LVYAVLLYEGVREYGRVGGVSIVVTGMLDYLGVVGHQPFIPR
jgi:hypothetical protein